MLLNKNKEKLLTKKRNLLNVKQILKKAFNKIYPDKTLPELKINYSGKFSDYNANVKIIKSGRLITSLEFGLSLKWLESDEIIIIGLIQHLLNKVYKTDKKTLEQELYNNFIKNIGKFLTPKKSDPFLEELFNELNEEYFLGLMEKPTLIIGGEALTVLGHYNFAKDTITISHALMENRNLTKYVLYHEMLHKKHSFKTKNGRGQYHTKEFRNDEKKFLTPNIEKQLESFIKKKKIKQAIFGKKKNIKKNIQYKENNYFFNKKENNNDDNNRKKEFSNKREKNNKLLDKKPQIRRKLMDWF